MLTFTACGGSTGSDLPSGVSPQSLNDPLDGMAEDPKTQVKSEECFLVSNINLKMGNGGLTTEVIANLIVNGVVNTTPISLIRFIESSQQTLNNAIDLQVLEMIKFSYQTQSKICTNIRKVCLPNTIGVSNCPAAQFSIQK